jgi:hypothetical protein
MQICVRVANMDLGSAGHPWNDTTSPRLRSAGKTAMGQIPSGVPAGADISLDLQT